MFCERCESVPDFGAGSLETHAPVQVSPPLEASTAPGGNASSNQMVSAGQGVPPETLTLNCTGSGAKPLVKLALAFTTSGESLSASVAVTFRELRPLLLTVKTALPFALSASCAAANVTVCGVAQLEVVKLSAAPLLTLRSASPLVRATFTVVVAVGATLSRTVKVCVPPSGTVTALALAISAGVAAVGSPPSRNSVRFVLPSLSKSSLPFTCVTVVIASAGFAFTMRHSKSSPIASRSPSTQSFGLLGKASLESGMRSPSLSVVAFTPQPSSLKNSLSLNIVCRARVTASVAFGVAWRSTVSVRERLTNRFCPPVPSALNISPESDVPVTASSHQLTP